MDLNGVTLAYIGDAVYEIMVREMVLNKGIKKVQNLHQEVIQYTSAEGQEKAFYIIESSLNEEEMTIFKRGRNAKTERKARNASIDTYRKSTGFEAVIGYLYLNQNQNRLQDLFERIVKGFER